jgi:transcriptional regulator with PAS, ATPase and Fis domain
LEQAKNGGRHYLDDLFCGRVQLLENDFEGANISFSRLTENINRFGAKNRLAFELQFAKEMKLSNVLRLINGWKSENKVISSKIKTPAFEKKYILEKGVKLLIGESLSIKHVKDLVKKYATLNAPILVTGETGTGKELVSRAIHDEGPNPDEPFLAINCGALTDTLLQSELFGYEAGAFTGAQKQRKGIFEAAGKGTVFLDEFGEISPKLQVSLLRVLDANEIRMIGSTVTRMIECKIVIATNVNLHNAVVDKKIREDLFFRLARFEIKLPSLRERVEDIPDLINHFLLMSSIELGKKKSLSIELLKQLTNYHWPGNIRELKNEIERLYILNPDNELLGLEHLDSSHLQAPLKIGINQPLVKPLVDTAKENFSSEDALVLKVVQNGFPIEQRHTRLKELFLKYKKFTRSQIMEIFKIGATTASKDLQFLIDSGFIVRKSPTKSTRTDYFELIKQD